MRFDFRFFVVAVCAFGFASLLHSDPVVTVQDDGRPHEIGPTAMLTEATAKRLLGPVAALAMSQVTATTAGTSGVPARANRMRIVLENISTENVWWSGTNPATSTSSMLIVAGASQGSLYNGPVYLYSASGTAKVCVTEGYNP